MIGAVEFIAAGDRGTRDYKTGNTSLATVRGASGWRNWARGNRRWLLAVRWRGFYEHVFLWGEKSRRTTSAIGNMSAHVAPALDPPPPPPSPFWLLWPARAVLEPHRRQSAAAPSLANVANATG